ncbi:GumC family protein [Methylobacterium isbiliense]|uniref:Polysaccharide chain length determinant N-terminal domain-containing protein n=1 Tax=Methylobacterium isbiliense TaxID=315478 RepID=A0ABQ4SR94_9HYPH|nr:hypothetical protein [Methylobacterium isbiliense]MDN3625926.1 hypothetical protein [Methylobacterium isbiliense]GJE04191.1 hypothetical protein GMJLKIPL_6152 [Methylobacterium isbiliense]
MTKLEAEIGLPPAKSRAMTRTVTGSGVRDTGATLLFVVFKWLPQMAAVVGIGILCGLGYLSLVRGNMFQANAKLYVRVGVDQTPSPLLGSDRNVTFLAQTRGAVQSEMDLLRNEVLVSRLIADLNLGAPEARPEPTGLYDRLKRLGSDLYQGARDGADAILVMVGLKTPQSRSAAVSQVFAQSLILDNAPGSDVISVSLRWPGEAQAVQLLDRFLQIYTNFRSAVFEGGGEIDFLHTKRNVAKAAVEAVEAEMAVFEREHDTRNAASRAPLLEADLVEAQRALERQTLELDFARRRFDRLSRVLSRTANQREPVGLGTFPPNSPALSMAPSMVALLGERERLLVNNSVSAPEVREIEAKLGALTVVLLRQLEAEVQDLAHVETTARERVEKVVTALREFQDAATGWKSLERRRELAEARYRDAEKRLGEARDIAALRNARLSNVVVVQPAAAEGTPIGLRKLSMLGIITLCSSVLACGWALVREVFDGRLYRGEEAAAELGLPLASEVPEHDRLLQVWSQCDPAAAAARVALDRLVVTVSERLRGERKAVLAVAAAEAEEGASTMALALAHGMARRGRKAVRLISGSTSQALLHHARALRVRLDPLPTSPDLPAGLSLTAVGDHLVVGTWEDAEAAGAFLRGDFASCPGLQGDAGLVILDLPPLLSDAEAPLCASRADATLLVVRAGRHAAARHIAALEALRWLGVEPIGIVLNRVRRFVPARLEQV